MVTSSEKRHVVKPTPVYQTKHRTNAVLNCPDMGYLEDSNRTVFNNCRGLVWIMD
jgi:hypothetical protein